jgi:hypothetical protein
MHVRYARYIGHSGRLTPCLHTTTARRVFRHHVPNYRTELTSRLEPRLTGWCERLWRLWCCCF